MASSRFLSFYRSVIRPVAAYLTQATPKNDGIGNAVGRSLFGKFDMSHPTHIWDEVVKKIDPSYVFPFMERVCDMRESDDSVVFRLYLFGLGKEAIKVHADNNTLYVEDLDGIFVAKFDLAGKHCNIHNIKAVMKTGVLKVVVPKLMKEDEEKDEDAIIHVE